MIPRCRPPTAIALPRNSGFIACSTEAKKASASKWTILRTRSVDGDFLIGRIYSGKTFKKVLSSPCGVTFITQSVEGQMNLEHCAKGGSES